MIGISSMTGVAVTADAVVGKRKSRRASTDEADTKSQQKRGRNDGPSDRAAGDEVGVAEARAAEEDVSAPHADPFEFRTHDGHESASGSADAMYAFVSAFTACAPVRQAALDFVPFMTLPLYDCDASGAQMPTESGAAVPAHPMPAVTTTTTTTTKRKTHPVASLVPVWYRWRLLPSSASPLFRMLLPWQSRLVWARAVATTDYRSDFETGRDRKAVPFKCDSRCVTFDARIHSPVFWLDTALCTDTQLADGRATMPAGSRNRYAFMPTTCVRCRMALPPSAACRQKRRDLLYTSSVDSVGCSPTLAVETFFDARALVMLHRVVEAWTTRLPHHHVPTLAQIACVIVEFACTDVGVANRS